jgi:hypothetical protein
VSTPYPGNSYWPGDYQGCTITASFVGLDGSAITGTVSLTASPASLLDAGAFKIIVPRGLTIPLVNGGFSVTVPATDDPDVNPHNWTYSVSENFTGGRKYSIFAPMNTTIDLSQASPVPASEGIPIYRGQAGDPGILVLGPTDAIPLGTPAGTIIARTGLASLYVRS